LLILSPDPRRVGTFSSAPDACGAISEYERVVDELYTREVFCVHHELERFNFDPVPIDGTGGEFPSRNGGRGVSTAAGDNVISPLPVARVKRC
jgi:hypothetical protein